MTIRRIYAGAALLGCGGILACAQNFDPSSAVPDQMIIQVAPPFTLADALTRIQQQIPNVTPADAIESRSIYLLNAPGLNEATAEVFLDSLQNPTPSIPNPNRPLIWGEVGYMFGAAEGQTGSIYFGRLPSAAAAGAFQSQYPAALMDVPTAHTVTTGGGATVAVLDTGLDSEHVLFNQRIADGGWNVIQGQEGPDFSDSRNLSDDDGDGQIDEGWGHGTYVAALVLRVAPEASILPIKVLNSDGRGGSWELIRGLALSIDSGAHVINMSLRSNYDSDIVNDLCLEAQSRGIVLTAAAGNLGVSSDDRENREYPAMNEIIIGVGATDWLDRRAPFSNFNDEVGDPRFTLQAPGDSAGVAGQPATWNPANCIYSALSDGAGDEYSVWEGTSMSSAFAAGGAALIRARFPFLGECQRTRRIVEHQIRVHAVNIDAQNPSEAGLFGWGRLAIGASVTAELPAIACDYNLDGAVGLPDLTIFLAAFGSEDSCIELNGQPGIGLGDLTIFLSNFGAVQ